MCAQQMLRVWLVALATGLVMLTAGIAAPGCGREQQIDGLVAVPATSTSATTTSEADTGGSTGGVTSVFVEVAEAVPTLPIYGVRELPAGVTVASAWWPVLEVEKPEEYRGPLVANPRIQQGGEAGGAEVQVVLQSGEGWLIVLEDFRGDLGDVSGKAVGEVDGHTGTLYELNGGRLVQWSDSGKWYGVFGRGVAEDLVVGMALSMTRLIPGESR